MSVTDKKINKSGSCSCGIYNVFVLYVILLTRFLIHISFWLVSYLFMWFNKRCLWSKFKQALQEIESQNKIILFVSTPQLVTLVNSYCTNREIYVYRNICLCMYISFFFHINVIIFIFLTTHLDCLLLEV